MDPESRTYKVAKAMLKDVLTHVDSVGLYTLQSASVGRHRYSVPPVG